jgi:hypothetical protein
MMEAARTSEKLVNFYHFTRRYNPEDIHLNTKSIRGSSGSLMSDYGLDDRGSISNRGNSFSLCIKTGFGAHPAPYPKGTGGPLLGGKARPGRDADHSHLI